MNLTNTLSSKRTPRKPQWSRSVGALCLSAVLLQPVTAQIPARGPLDAQALSPVVEDAQPLSSADVLKLIAKMPASALLAVDQNRASIIDTVVNQWRTELASASDGKGLEAQIAELRASLSSLRADQLLAASNARTLPGLKYLFAAADAAQATALASDKATEKASQGAQKRGDGPKGFTSLTSDLTYTPITPCKLVDTRSPGTGYTYANGGAFAASEKRTYNSYSGCGPTVPNMAAIQVSAVSSYGGVGGGILSMMANLAAAPLTNVFYSGYVPVTTTVPVNGAFPGGLFDVQITGVSGAHMIIEVVGYFAAPTPTALQCLSPAFETFPLPIGFNSYHYTTATCPSGYTETSAICYNNSIPDIYSMGSGIGSGGGAFCAWRNLSGAAQSVQQSTQCCRVPGRP